MTRTTLCLSAFLFAGCQSANAGGKTPAEAAPAEHFTVVHTEAEWRKILTPEQFHILREQGTEAPFANAYFNDHRHAVYRCAGCGLVLFKSEDKFDSGTGWPSFVRPATPSSVATRVDGSLGSVRTEVHCPRCGGHLGHVFEDGPKPTGLRYCIDSASLKQELVKP